MSEQDLNGILTVNQQDAQAWQAAGLQFNPEDLQTDMEAVKYALWLDSKRSTAFFAEKVLLVEGPTETALLTYMYDRGLLSDCKGVFIMDTIGKYNTHRFMRLFSELGIRHYVLYDGDNGRHAAIDATIRATVNPFTGGIDTFENDLEGFLGVPPAGRSDRKPQHVMLHVERHAINLAALAEKVNSLVAL